MGGKLSPDAQKVLGALGAWQRANSQETEATRTLGMNVIAGISEVPGERVVAALKELLASGKIQGSLAEDALGRFTVPD